MEIMDEPSVVSEASSSSSATGVPSGSKKQQIATSTLRSDTIKMEITDEPSKLLEASSSSGTTGMISDTKKEKIAAATPGQSAVFVENRNINNNLRPVKAAVLIVVLSARGNFERRAAIREIWGTDDVYFAVGSRCPFPRAGKHAGCENTSNTTGVNATFQAQMDREEELLLKERAEFRDIILSPAPESYLSLTNKLKTAYRFALQEKGVEWIIKADDDFYVSVPRLQTFVGQYNSSALHVIGCLVWCCAPVRPAGKNADTVFQGGKGNYPWFPRGSCGHGISIALARRLLSLGDDGLKEYPGEDTSLGIWIQEAPFRREVVWIRAYEEQGTKRYFFNKQKDKNGHMGNQWLDAEARFSSNDYCDNTQYLMMGHDITPAKMRECHESRNAT